MGRDPRQITIQREERRRNRRRVARIYLDNKRNSRYKDAVSWRYGLHMSATAESR